MPASIRSYLQHAVYLLRRPLKRTLQGWDIRITTQWGISLILDLSKDVDFDTFMGKFESDHISMFSSLVRPGDIVIDVGANIGIYSLVASKSAGREGRIFSFEPSQWAKSRLEKNITLNDAQNITVIPLGVSKSEGAVDFYICEDDAYNSIGKIPMMPVVRTETIRVTSLDDFCRENSLSRVDIVKIDTEGADYLVLQGAAKLLDSEKAPIIFCEVNKSTKEGFDYPLNEYISFLRNKHYELYEINRESTKLVPYDENVSSCNEIICLKEHHRTEFYRRMLFTV